MEIVRFSPAHIKDAAEMEMLCFSDPWTEEGLLLLCEPGYVAFSAVEEGRVLAYAGMSTVLDEGQVLNVAVHPDFRRCGLGRAVLSALIDYADKNGISTLSLEVRESNLPAISLYRSAGFEVVGKRPRFYSHPTETALIMLRARK